MGRRARRTRNEIVEYLRRRRNRAYGAVEKKPRLIISTAAAAEKAIITRMLYISGTDLAADA